MAAPLRSLPLWLAALALAPPACAEPGQAPPVAVFGQALAYQTLVTPSASRFNPENALAAIAHRQLNAELRLNLSATLGRCKALAKLRGRASRTAHAETLGVPAQEHTGFLNEGGMRCRAGQQAELSVGREVLQWGSSIFLSPSNPFFIDTGKTNPIQELAGKDTVQAHWFAAPGATVSLIRSYRHGAQESDPANFSAATAARFDWIGEDASGGAIVSRRANGVRRLGLYGTLPLSKAALVYADLSAGRGNAGWFARPDAASPTGWRFVQDKLYGSAVFHTILAGAAYTTEAGWTLSVEWVNGNEGYSASERQAYQDAASRAAPLLLARRAGAAAAAGLLGTALAPNLPYLSRNYLFMQLLRTEWSDKGDVALRLARPLGADRGVALSGSLTYYLSNHMQLFVVASRNTGGDQSEFARLIQSSVQAGIRTTF